MNRTPTGKVLVHQSAQSIPYVLLAAIKRRLAFGAGQDASGFGFAFCCFGLDPLGVGLAAERLGVRGPPRIELVDVRAVLLLRARARVGTIMVCRKIP